MMISKWALVSMVMLVWVGCSGIQTSQDYQPATNFQALRTAAWASPTQPETGDERIDNPFRDTRIRAAIERQLAQKGIVLETERRPDVRIRYQYTLRQRIDSSGGSSGIGFGIGSYGSHGGIAIGTGNNVREVDEGTLVIDLVSADADTLLWRGSGTQRFREYDDPVKATADIDALVDAIMKQFPPES